MRYLILISLLIGPFSASAELYRWVDEKGNVHYSDKPLHGGDKTFTPPPLTTVPAAASGNYNFSKKSDKSKPVKYTSIEITSPSDDHVFTPDKATSIAVQASLQPGLQRRFSHQFALYLDGQLHQEGKLSANLVNLNRGTHTVYAAVLDKKGKILLKSKPVSFHVQKHGL